MNRNLLAVQILERLRQERGRLTLEFTQHSIKSCFVDDLLPEQTALEIFRAFPPPTEMVLRKSIRERKYVSADLNRHNELLKEITFAFQDPAIVKMLSEITGLDPITADENLYAGGISMMGKGHFLNPHLDNSHDKDRENYRVLNLLYYVTPNWKEEYGGNLELWDGGMRAMPRTIWSKFNRLVIMQTGKSSLHSVNKINRDGSRCCVSNYYFSPRSPETSDYFHVTAFRGRPESPMTDLLLRADAVARNAIRALFKKGVVKPWHVYRK